jgi:hypothetical protein
MVGLAKWFMPAIRKISTKSKRPRNMTGAAVVACVLDAGRDCARLAMGFLLNSISN